ncbi:hypothetical protein QQM79_14740 [Marinobacteraceae bacterium S3BR75-40.1]
MRNLSIYRASAAFLLLCGLFLGLPALAAGPNTFSYVYAPVLGTGAYKAGDETILVIKMPFSIALDDEDDPGIKRKILLTTTAGISNFDFKSVAEDPTDRLKSPRDDVKTISFLPGMKWTIPLEGDAHVSPFAQIGRARDAGRDIDATLGIAGVKHVRTWPINRRWLTLGNSVIFAGQRLDSSGEKQGFLLFENGLDYEWPTGWRAMGTQLTMSSYVLWRHFGNQLDMVGVQGEKVKIKDLFSLGVTFGFHEAVDWSIPIQRVGVSLTRGDDLKAITFNLGFPF